MTEGRSRTAASVELTREGAARDPLESASISAVALSPDGRWAAITSQRTRFLLPALRLVDTPTTLPGLEELYLIDLEGRTLERALRGLRGRERGGRRGAAALGLGRRAARGVRLQRRQPVLR